MNADEAERRAYEAGQLAAVCNVRNPHATRSLCPYRLPRLIRAWHEGVQDYRREACADPKFKAENDRRRESFRGAIEQWLEQTK